MQRYLKICKIFDWAPPGSTIDASACASCIMTLADNGISSRLEPQTHSVLHSDSEVRAGSRRAVLHSSQAAPLAGPSEPKRSGDPLRIPHRRSGAAFSGPCAGATARRAAGPGLTGIRTPRHREATSSFLVCRLLYLVSSSSFHGTPEPK